MPSSGGQLGLSRGCSWSAVSRLSVCRWRKWPPGGGGGGGVNGQGSRRIIDACWLNETAIQRYRRYVCRHLVAVDILKHGLFQFLFTLLLHQLKAYSHVIFAQAVTCRDEIGRLKSIHEFGN